MANMYTQLAGNETPGEKALYYRFNNKLSEQFSVWHNFVFHSTSQEVDFIVLHPSYGMWLIEVKDWLLPQLEAVDSSTCRINKDGRSVNYPNPLLQARRGWIALKETLEKKSELLNNDGSIHQGKLMFPLNYAAAFYNISQSQIREHNLEPFLPTQRLITSEFIQGEGISDEEWEKKLVSLRERDFHRELSNEQIDIIKATLGVTTVKDSQTGRVVGTLDEKQKPLAEFAIEKQIVIEGPAGSGKSIVLLKRALHIKAKYPSWDVGIICFNAVMANYLRLLLSLEDKPADIDVYDVYDWVRKYLPAANTLWKTVDDPEKAIGLALEQAKDKLNRQYDALLVDEGQDSSEILLKLYRAMLKRTDASFTFCFDKRQALYPPDEFVDRLDEFGFNIDKQKELVKQQRSLFVLLGLAFYKKMKEPSSDLVRIIQEVNDLAERYFYGLKEKISRLATGVARFFRLTKAAGPPDLKSELASATHIQKCNSITEIISRVTDDIVASVNSQTASYGDWLVIFPMRNISGSNIPELLAASFKARLLPFVYVDKESFRAPDPSYDSTTTDNRRTAHLNENTVKVMTINAAKGFDSQRVAILAFDSLAYVRINKAAELGYVAITRGKQFCSIYFIERSRPVEALESVFARLI
jgi:hypothetical protein